MQYIFIIFLHLIQKYFQMTSNYYKGNSSYYVNGSTTYSANSQDLLNVPKVRNKNYVEYTPKHNDYTDFNHSSRKYGQDSRRSKGSSFHSSNQAQSSVKAHSHSNEHSQSQKSLKLNEIISQITGKLSELQISPNSSQRMLSQNLTTGKITSEIKTLLKNIKKLDSEENTSQQITKARQRIKLLQAENNQLKTKLEKNTFLQKKQLKDFVPKDRYQKLKEKLQDALNRSKKYIRTQSENNEDIQSYINRNIQKGNKELELQDQATVIAQEVAKVYFELDQIIKENHLTQLFYPKQLHEISKKIQLLVDPKIYEKILQKIKLTRIYHVLPELTEARQAELHFLYQDIIEKLVREIQKLKAKHQNQFQATMRKITESNTLKVPSKRRSSIQKQLKSCNSTTEDNKQEIDEKSFNSETMQTYLEKIKHLEQDNENLIKKNQDLQDQLEQKRQNSQSSYIYELAYEIACTLPLQDIQLAMFCPQNDADCISLLYQIRFFAKKYEEKQKQLDTRIQQFEKRIIELLKKLIQSHNIQKAEIMKQVNTWATVGNLRNLIHQYYHSRETTEDRQKKNFSVYEKTLESKR